MKTGIVIITHNLPVEVFLLQVAAIKKFCKDDFTIEVIENSTDNEKAEAIRYHAIDRLRLHYTKTIPHTNDFSNSHAFAANTAYHRLQSKYELFLFLDHDCIPVKPFSVKEILGGRIAAGIKQIRGSIEYFWPGCFMFDNKNVDQSLIDFMPSQDLKLDTGGMLYRLVERYCNDRCVFFDECYHQNKEYFGSYDFFAGIYNNTFYHFINASNWNNVENNTNRLNSLINYVKTETGL